VQSDQTQILVAGGGIGGLTLALAAVRLGLRVEVWERAPELREVGAGLLLTANAMWVLDRLGIEADVVEVGRPMQRWQILDRRGLAMQSFRSSNARPISVSVARSSFHDVLRQALPEGILFLAREVAAIEVLPGNNRVCIRATNGTERAAEVVIGADGGKSRVREILLGNSTARTCPYIGWRALVDLVPNGWNDGRLTESWGEGCRFGIAQVSATRSYWYATENVKPGWSIPVGKRRDYLLAKFRHWHQPVCAMIEATPEEHILLNSIAEHDRPPHWADGPVALLGDAAHLMTPNLGQGAALAMEDALTLAQCLSASGCTPAALQLYERRRKNRAAWVVWQSRQVGRMIQIQRPWLCAARDLALRCAPDAMSRLATAPVFDFRV